MKLKMGKKGTGIIGKMMSSKTTVSKHYIESQLAFFVCVGVRYKKRKNCKNLGSGR